ncbi:MAG: 16S rRNA methyltransferase [Thermoprotei archaeon]|nr:MAG: 16S rRNA methyltransferase [Thermoprotei archaeon]
MWTTGTDNTGARINPLRLVLAEAALELVPREIQHHPEVLAYARRRSKDPSKVLLDKSFHFHAMASLRDKHKRGRPDIVHFFLLETLSSILNRRDLLRVYIHTYTGQVIEVKPETRIPRNYVRFVGLMEQLLATGRVPPNASEPLLKVRRQTFADMVRMLKPDLVLLLDESGIPYRLGELGRLVARLMLAGLEVVVVIGGFPHGNFSEEILRNTSLCVSIYPSPLETWTVVSRLLCAVEVALGLV